MKLTKEQKIEKIRASIGITSDIQDDLIAILNYLPYCEWDLIMYMNQQKVWVGDVPTTAPNGYTSDSGTVDFGLFSYWLINPSMINNETLREDILIIEITIDLALALYNYEKGTNYTLQSLLNSQMTEANYNVLSNTTNPLVYSDGSILSTETYATYDQGWFGAFYNLLQTTINGWAYKQGNFPTATPTPINLTGKNPNQVTIAMMGDWGTGSTDPQNGSQNVALQMAGLNPDYIIHLGDVYYSGTPSVNDPNGAAYERPEEENTNLLNAWPTGYDGKSFTLNSNHEMYTGATGYFLDALKATTLPPGTGTPFSAQQGMSFFALNYGGWTILGLDSAFNANITNAFLNGQLDGSTPVQAKWINGLGLTPGKTIVLTHHTGFAYDCSSLNWAWDNATKSEACLWNQVNGALGADPYAWYWGHVHNGIVYTSPVNIPVSSVQPTAFTTNTFARCLGHGALPYGYATIINQANVEWQEGAPNQSTVLPNGFVLLTLTLNNNQVDTITEVFYNVGEAGVPVAVFSKTIYPAPSALGNS